MMTIIHPAFMWSIMEKGFDRYKCCLYRIWFCQKFDFGFWNKTKQKTDKVEAACTTPGKKAYYTCGTCGKHFEDEAGTVEIANLDEYGNIPATGHTFAWIVDKDATAAEAGLKHEECTVCGYAKAAVEIPAKETADGPQTGDSGNLVLWAAVMLAAGATVIGTVLYRQKKKISG